MWQRQSHLRPQRFVLFCQPAVAENQPITKYRMNRELSNFAARLLPLMREPARPVSNKTFNELALELFELQFRCNAPYRKICEVRKASPQTVEHWTQAPAIPTAAFKELDLTVISTGQRTAVFHSSGTTGQKPSRHYHCAESLAVYEASLWTWFQVHLKGSDEFLFLTPNRSDAPRSSLVHMFETVRLKCGHPESVFAGCLAADGSWAIDFAAVIKRLKAAGESGGRLTVMGTAFSFVHLLDYLEQNRLKFHLPAGSRVMETGGYKNRSRVMPKLELHGLIQERLGVPAEQVICEYGMSELSSQAYDSCIGPQLLNRHPRSFHFPPWAQVRIISPETGREVAEGEAGLIRMHDLANVFSVAAIQTEDLGVRRGAGFELLGRAQLAEPRGCSLMTA